MSVRAVAWVLESTRTMDAGRRMVLVALADYAGEADLAWCSLGTLGEVAGCSPDTARRSLADAKAEGWIETIAPDDPMVPDTYQAIRPDRRPTIWHFTGLHHATPRGGDGVATGSRRGRAATRPEPKNLRTVTTGAASHLDEKDGVLGETAAAAAALAARHDEERRRADEPVPRPPLAKARDSGADERETAK